MNVPMTGAVPLFLSQEYSWVYVKVYTAAGNIGDTIPAGWQNNLLWTGRMDIPHMYDYEGLNKASFGGLAIGAFADGRKIGLNGNDMSVTTDPWYLWQNNYATQVRHTYLVQNHCPYFDYTVSVTSSLGGGSGTSGKPLFKAFYVASGPASQPLVIVTIEGFSDAYVFNASDEDCWTWPARILSDGSLTVDASAPMTLPALYSTTSRFYFRGLLISGITDESDLTEIIGFRLAGMTTNDNLVVGYFSQAPETWARTMDFLNRWPLNGRSFFDYNSFLKGVLTGQRLREWAAGNAPVQDAPPVSGGGGSYNEKSFLSGLAAGRALHGWPMR